MAADNVSTSDAAAAIAKAGGKSSRPTTRSGCSRSWHHRADSSRRRQPPRSSSVPHTTPRSARLPRRSSRATSRRKHRPRQRQRRSPAARSRQPPAWTRWTTSCGASRWSRRTRPARSTPVTSGSPSASSTPASTRRNPTSPRTSTGRCRATSRPDMPTSTARARSPSCLDPVGTDDGGHGTHVAGTIGAAANGFGVSGVAPNVSPGRAQGRPGLRLLLPRAGRQRARLRRRARHRRGQHVVLRRPVAVQLHRQPGRLARARRPSSAPSSRRMFRALTYAHHKGVTLVGALGNDHEDMGKPAHRHHQPRLPGGHRIPAPDRQRTPAGTCRSRART